jgi:hypothetical protein
MIVYRNILLEITSEKKKRQFLYILGIIKVQVNGEKTYFDPAFWKYEGAQAKIVVYYPRNEV